MKKKVKLIPLLLAFLLILSACGTGGTEPTIIDAGTQSQEPTATAESGEPADNPPEAIDETLRVLISAEPGNIMPQNSILGDGQHIASSMYDTLLTYNSKTNELEPGVATSWEWIDDLHLRLYLRDDVVAYDGTILTAHDVLYSVQQGLSGSAAVFWKAVDGDECSVEDDFTFVLGLNQIYPTITYQLVNQMMLTLLDESSVELSGGWEANIRAPKCTTGQYFFDEWKDGEYIRLVRNDDYWGEKGYYKYIEFRYNADNASRVMALAAGEADITVDLSSVDILSLESYANCYSTVTPSGGTNVLYMNITNEYLNNALVREAIYLAIDANSINIIGSGGLAKIATGPFESTNVVYSPPKDGAERAVDVDRAKQLLAEAGYPNGFSVNMFTLNFNQTMCEAIQADLLKIGITVNLEVVEMMTAMQRNDLGDFDITVAQTFTDDPVNVCNYIDDRMPINTRGGGIVGGLPESYNTIDRCRVAAEADERLEAYAELQDFIREQYLIVPFYEYCTVYGANGSFDYYQNIIGIIKYGTMKPS